MSFYNPSPMALAMVTRIAAHYGGCVIVVGEEPLTAEPPDIVEIARKMEVDAARFTDSSSFYATDVAPAYQGPVDWRHGRGKKFARHRMPARRKRRK